MITHNIMIGDEGNKLQCSDFDGYFGAGTNFYKLQSRNFEHLWWWIISNMDRAYLVAIEDII